MEADASPQEDLVAAFMQEGVYLDSERGLLSVRARVGVREHLLEHLLAGPAGEAHEAMLVTDVTPSVLNTALLLLGLEPGRNARWLEPEPPPSTGEPSSRPAAPAVALPEGDGVLLYVGWREGGEDYLYRAEDLIENLATQRRMQRHRWVYLGSRLIQRDNLSKTDRRLETVFAADVLQDLINVTFFYEGNTLITAALPSSFNQNIWRPITPLFPPRGSPVSLIIAKHPINVLYDPLRVQLPVVVHRDETNPSSVSTSARRSRGFGAED